jgi:hypothetical protein
MRIATSVFATLIGIFAMGCGERSAITTAPVGPAPELRAETAAEVAVERRHAELAASSGGLTQVAAAACEFDVPPEVFGVLIDNRLFYVAAKNAAGNVSGLFSYTQAAAGETFRFAGRITCMNLYDYDGGTLNRAKLGGPIDYSNDPTIPVGTFIWWQTIDNTQSPGSLPDKSTLSGFGDEAANTAFCNNPAPPRFGPWDVDRGNIAVRSLSGTIAASQ